jgi:hypothetical protein
MLATNELTTTTLPILPEPTANLPALILQSLSGDPTKSDLKRRSDTAHEAAIEWARTRGESNRNLYNVLGQAYLMYRAALRHPDVLDHLCKHHDIQVRSNTTDPVALKVIKLVFRDRTEGRRLRHHTLKDIENGLREANQRASDYGLALIAISRCQPEPVTAKDAFEVINYYGLDELTQPNRRNGIDLYRDSDCIAWQISTHNDADDPEYATLPEPTEPLTEPAPVPQDEQDESTTPDETSADAAPDEPAQDEPDPDEARAEQPESNQTQILGARAGQLRLAVMDGTRILLKIDPENSDHLHLVNAILGLPE